MMEMELFFIGSIISLLGLLIYIVRTNMNRVKKSQFNKYYKPQVPILNEIHETRNIKLMLKLNPEMIHRHYSEWDNIASLEALLDKYEAKLSTISDRDIISKQVTRHHYLHLVSYIFELKQLNKKIQNDLKFF